MELSHEKSYEFQTENGSKVEVKIEAKVKDLNRADLKETLHRYAAYTRNFYLSLGNKIAETDAVSFSLGGKSLS